jgi:hypothetical protein
LREHNKNLYWNLIWYFADYSLPYDFMVPYSGEDWLWNEFLHTNDHLVVRNKTRLDQMLREDGGYDRFCIYMEEKLKVAQKKEAAELQKKRAFSHSSSYYQFNANMHEGMTEVERRKGKKVKKIKKSESSLQPVNELRLS